MKFLTVMWFWTFQFLDLCLNCEIRPFKVKFYIFLLKKYKEPNRSVALKCEKKLRKRCDTPKIGWYVPSKYSIWCVKIVSIVYSSHSTCTILEKNKVDKKICHKYQNFTRMFPPFVQCCWDLWTFHVHSFFNIDIREKGTGKKGSGTTLSIFMKIKISFLQIWQGRETH